jgi:hypothetical protein
MVGDCSVRRLSAAGIVLGGLLLLVSPVAVADPLVTGVVASDSLVSDADTSGLFTVTVDFDVAMNTSTSPTLIFAPDVSSTLVLLPLPGGSWADSDTYIATYSVSDANADVDSVTIDVTGAWDLAGEPQRDYTPVHEFEIDTRNPSAPVVAGIATDAGSSNADAVTNDSTLILSGTAESQSSVRLCRDGSPMGGPVVALGTGTWTFDYRGTVLPDGTYRFTATATDVAGNVSPESAPLTVLVDTQGAPAPEGRTPPDGTRTNDITPTFSWTAVAADPGGSGVRDYGYSVLGPTPKSGTTTGTTYTPSPGSPLGDGNYTWKLRTRDVAGNLGAYGSSWSFVIDTVSPTVTIAASDVAIYDGDVGVGRFTVTATFSEAMSPAVLPALTLTPNPATTFTNSSGEWSVGNTEYTWTYDVVDVGVSVPDVDVTVAGGRDVAGNLQILSTNTDYVDIDTQNPTVTSVAANDVLISDADTPGDATFTLTVEFSEPMNIGYAPTLTLSPAVGSTLAFDPTSDWLDTYTYVARYDTADANVDVNSVTVDVAGTRDAAGNAQQDYAPVHEFEIDTLNPTVTSVVARDVLIADSDAGLTLYITADFSEPMDPAAVPVFTFAPDVSSTLTLTGGTWQTTVQYRASYVAADTNIDVNSVTVDVTAPRDVAGNAQQDYAPQHEFEIDTLNPTVVGILLSDPLITDADVGGIFTVTANYSEPMQASTAPTIVFVPGLATTLSLLGTSGWADADTYIARYTVLDGEVTVDDDDVQVSLARDLADNVQMPSSLDDQLDVDTENPIISGFTVTGGQVGTKSGNDCVREVTFAATVTDPNGRMDPSAIVITSATVHTGNASITGPYAVTRISSATEVAVIAGTVDVYDLTSCPAVSRIVLDATDVVGNSAVQAREEDGVYDAILPTINGLTFNIDDSYEMPTGEYEVDTCCVTTVHFSANVTDNCCISAGSIGVTVTLPTENAALENVVWTAVQDGRKRVNVTGRADVRCPTSCFARVQVVITAHDCCSNQAATVTSASGEGLVWDRLPPVPADDPKGYEAARCDDLEVRRDDFNQFRLMIRENTPSYIDVLCNDTDNCSACTCCATLWIHDIVDQPEFGTATIVDSVGNCRGGTSIRYAPDRGYIGPDQFTYRIIDACGNVSVEATVYLQTIREVSLADVFATACSGAVAEITVAATDLWIDPNDPSRVQFGFDITSGPEHGVLAVDLEAIQYTSPSTEAADGTLVPTLTFMESASVVLWYAPAREYLGRDAIRVAFRDPFGGVAIGNVDIEVQACPWVGESPLVIPQGALLPLIVPVSFFANVYETAWDTVTLTGEGGTEHPEAVLATWSESLGRPTLVVDTGPLTLGAYELVVPLGNGETVTLRFVVGETP